jgi:hypothetical protein
MKKDKQVYLHGEGLKEAKFIEIGSETKISDIIKEFEAITGVASSTEAPVECYGDEDDNPLDKSSTAGAKKIDKRSHVHCHRCRKVEVAVMYNGREEKFSFPPQTKVEKVFKKAIKEFKISDSDATNLVLRFGNGQGEILQDDDHIGSFVSYPACHLSLYLTPKKQVQG